MVAAGTGEVVGAPMAEVAAGISAAAEATRVSAAAGTPRGIQAGWHLALARLEDLAVMRAVVTMARGLTA